MNKKFFYLAEVRNPYDNQRYALSEKNLAEEYPLDYDYIDELFPVADYEAALEVVVEDYGYPRDMVFEVE